MSIESAIRARLVAYTGLTDLVSTRVYRQHLPQPVTLPAVTVQLVSDQPLNRSMGNDTGAHRARVQVDSWADDPLEARSIAEQVDGALRWWSGTGDGVTVDAVLFEDGRDGSPDPDRPAPYHFIHDWFAIYQVA